MSKPLYSGCEQDTVVCERTWSEFASWTLHSAIAKKQNRLSTTSSRTVPSGGNRDTSYGRRMSQPPTSCGERRKTCAAPPSSWQHVDWGSKHGWSTAEEEEEGDLLWILPRSIWWLRWLDSFSRECRISGCQEQILCRPPELGFEGHTSGPYLLPCLLMEWAGL